MTGRRRRPPSRNGKGRHRAALTPAQIAGRGIAVTAVLALLGSGIYTWVADERAVRGGYDPPLALPRPQPVDPSSIPAPSAIAPADPPLALGPDDVVNAAASDAPAIPSPDDLAEPPAESDPEPAAEDPPKAPSPEPEPDPEPEPEPDPEPDPEPEPEPDPGLVGSLLDDALSLVDTSCLIANIGADVLPHVRRVACFLDDEFPSVRSIGGRGSRGLAGSDHPRGLAVDFIVGSDRSLGDRIASCAARHFDDWNLSYVIWEQAILTRAGGSFRPMEDRGGDTANHFDHVHLSFRNDSAIPRKSLEC